MPNLASLQLASCSLLTNAAMAEVSQLPHLTSLDVSWSKNVTGSGLRHLMGVHSLKTLDLTGCDGVDWSNLSDLPQIVALLPHLTTLNISSTNITDQSVKELVNLSSLADLRLSCCKLVTGQGVAVLPRISKLTALDLSWCVEIIDSCVCLRSSTAVG